MADASRIGEGLTPHIRPVEHRAQGRQRAGIGISGQRACKQSPFGHELPRRRDPATARQRMSQEGAPRSRVLTRQRRQCHAALDERPKQQTLRFPPLRALRFKRLVQRKRGTDRLGIAIRFERAHLPGRTECAARTIDLVRHANPFQRDHGRQRCSRDKRSDPFCQLRVRGKKSLNAPYAFPVLAHRATSSGAGESARSGRPAS